MVIRNIGLFFLAGMLGYSPCQTLWGQCGPIEVVAAYCRLDSAGVRTTQNPMAIDSLVTWTWEPGWDSSMIIEGYDILQSHQEGDTFFVSVRYHQVGLRAGAQLLLASDEESGRVKRAEIVNFALVQWQHCWKIARPLITPHISLDCAISKYGRWLRETEDRVDPDTLDVSISKYISDMRITYDSLVRYRENKKR